jgi:ABC-type multidrug transport system fused ATPase/permease subunit
MFDKWLKLPAHYYLNLTALSLLAVGVILSNVLMSIGTIWIIANWLIEMDFKTKLDRFKSDKKIIAISMFFILMLISFLWTDDIDYAGKDLLVKLPLITIPLVMATIKPLEHKNYKFLLYLVLASLTFTTVFNFIRYNLYGFGDIREMSFFVSHIRLGGVICMTLFLVTFEIIKKRLSVWLIAPVLIWLLFYLVKAQTVSAYMLFTILLAVVVMFWLKKSKLKYVFIGVILLPLIFGTNYLYQNLSSVMPQTVEINSTENTDFSELQWYTASRYSYYHDTLSKATENGNLVWLYVCIEECEQEWNKRSDLSYDGEDKKGQPLYGTLFRYMSSKGLRKDSIGFMSMTNKDIINVELGNPNYITDKGVKGKIEELNTQFLIYKSGGNPNGHSFIQRIEHLKTALNLIKSNWIIGVGLGDIKVAFKTQYELDNSLLNIENQHRSHNQFLTNWISLGILGFLLTAFILFAPLFSEKLTFPLIIVSISLIFGFFTQDLIESQAGVTIFALFYTLVNYKEDYGKVG